MTRRLACLGACLSMLGGSTVGHAQTMAGGSIRGYVKDEQGAVLPGVTISAVSGEASGTHLAVSDEAGFYRLLDLPPANYTVIAELQGFARFEWANIIVRGGLNLGVDIVMKVGAVAEVIEVRAETPMLESSSAVQAVNITGDFQRRLPIAPLRQWMDFMNLSPGVVNDQGSAIGSGFYVHGADFTSNV